MELEIKNLKTEYSSLIQYQKARVIIIWGVIVGWILVRTAVKSNWDVLAYVF